MRSSRTAIRPAGRWSGRWACCGAHGSAGTSTPRGCASSQVEDGRYRALRAEWGARAPVRFLGVYVAQAVVATLFSLPLLAAMRGGALDGWAVAGTLVWIVAVAGETVADRQLAAFRARPGTRGEVCRDGLWGWSRHPNYFFEWIHWWTYVLVAHAAPLTFVGPVVMLALLLKGTGIPHTERQALRSRGDKYRAYMRTTSAFVPWPPSSPTHRHDGAPGRGGVRFRPLLTP